MSTRISDRFGLAVEARTSKKAASADRVLWAGLLAIGVVAAVLRLVSVGAHVPQLTSPDEPTTIMRALAALDGDLVPPAWDWPPGGAFVWAGAIGVLG